MFHFKYFVNENTMNVFTDASIQIVKDLDQKSYNGAIAALCEINGETKALETKFLPNTTNNYSELAAIRLGVDLIIRYCSLLPVKYINIFSDSKISIFGLREWIYNWTSTNGVFYGSTHEPIKNQDIIKDIVSTITLNGISVRFWHVRGHHDVNVNTKLDSFAKSFILENHLSPTSTFDKNLLKYLIEQNSMVDLASRSLFKKYSIDVNYVIPFTITMNQQFKMSQLPEYKRLTHPSTL